MPGSFNARRYHRSERLLSFLANLLDCLDGEGFLLVVATMVIIILTVLIRIVVETWSNPTSGLIA